MQTVVLMEPHLGRLVLYVLSLILLTHICLAAPGLTGAQREASVDIPPPSTVLANPFGSTEQDRRLLQSYIQSSLKDGQGEPEISTWEQEVFFLFRLYDYDRSGVLDGLEMMKLLSDYNSHNAHEQTNEQVVSMVDLLLQTQDLNQDGMLAPSELLSPPLPHIQDSTHNDELHQEQEQIVKEKLSNPSSVEEKAATLKEREEAHEEEIQPKQEETPEQEGKAGEVEEQNGQHFQEGEQGQEQQVPVHQGQPEI